MSLAEPERRPDTGPLHARPPRAFLPSSAEAEQEAREMPWGAHLPTYHQWLSEARTYLLWHFPFFGRLAMRMNFEITESVETAAIRADATCYFNPTFLERLSVEGRAFVIAHELCHVAFAYFDRVADRMADLFNAAHDYVINQILVDAGLEPPDGLKLLLDPQYKDMSAEEIYDLLRAKNPEGLGWAGLGFGRGLDCDHHWTSTLPDRYGLPVLTPSAWRDEMLDAIEASRFQGPGSVPVGVKRLVGRMIPPPRIPWQVVLARLAKTVLRNSTDWRRPSRRVPALRRRLERSFGFRTTLPGPRKSLAPVVVALDTSGSMSAAELKAAISETSAILALTNRPIRVLCCDAEVHVDVDIRRAEDLEVRGGGGTCTRPVFERIGRDSAQNRPSLLVYFSDLWATFPTEAPPYPVLWVQTKGSVARPVPFGSVVLYERP